MSLSDEDYRRLLALRTGLRHFQRWSEQQAQAAGLTPAQHQLLLAIRGHDDSRGPTIGEVADYLQLRHHSAVELIDRADGAGLVVRRRDRDDHRIVRLRLTALGAKRIKALSALHIEELQRLALRLPGTWQDLAPSPSSRRAIADSRTESSEVLVARVYDPLRVEKDRAVLVDRLWPRGLSREEAPFELWLKDVAPSSTLRRWYGHVPERFDEFAERYRRELRDEPARGAVAELRAMATAGGVTLLTATKDVVHSSASVLRDFMTQE